MSRLSRRNRERRGPEQVLSSPDGILPLSVTRERENTEGPDRSSGEAPECDCFLITCKRRQREEGGGRASQRSPEEASKERLRGSPGEGAPEQAEARETQKEAPERPRSRLGLVF